MDSKKRIEAKKHNSTTTFDPRASRSPRTGTEKW
ncbi:hypothetical protein M3J09_008083 [Ascochyta lentis]